jgi:hypothetical protein
MRRATLVCLAVVVLGSLAAIVGQNSGTKPPVVTYPRIVGTVSLPGQTEAIPTTTIFTPKNSGLFRISIYMTTVKPTNYTSVWSYYLGWTDDAGVEQTNYPGVVTLNEGNPPQAWGVQQSGYLWGPVLVFQAKAGAPVTYSVTQLGTADGSTYELFFTIEQLS